jgi:hypothetical protein
MFVRADDQRSDRGRFQLLPRRRRLHHRHGAGCPGPRRMSSSRIFRTAGSPGSGWRFGKETLNGVDDEFDGGKLRPIPHTRPGGVLRDEVTERPERVAHPSGIAIAQVSIEFRKLGSNRDPGPGVAETGYDPHGGIDHAGEVALDFFLRCQDDGRFWIRDAVVTRRETRGEDQSGKCPSKAG